MQKWWVRLAVGVSVGLNIFLIAFLLGQAWHPPANPGETALTAREILRQLADKLPPDDARRLRQAFASRQPELAALQRQLRATRERVRADIGAETLDLDQLRADVDAVHAAREKVRPVIEQALLDALPHLSKEGRQILSHYRLAPPRRGEP